VLPAGPYATEAPRLAVYDRLLAGVGALPGISSVTTTSMLPLGGGGQVNTIAAEGDTRPRAERPTANFRFIAPEFFHTLDVRIIRGRPFTDRERAADRPAPALVSARTARLLWPGQDAIGKRFSRGIADEQGFEVVGVTTDARTTSLAAPPPPMVYIPYWWRTRTATSLLIKTAGDPASLVQAVRRVVRAIDPDIAVGDARPLPAIVESSLAARRYQMRLFVAFGLAAMAIAIIGVYGVTSYHVARRRREMNLRIALGAKASQVLALVVRQGVTPVLAGLGAGVIGAIALGGVLAGVLFEVPARDPRIIGLAAAVVGAAGVATAFLAARRELTIDPAAALRDE